MKITIALLISLFAVACGQTPEQWFPGLTKLDTALFRLETSVPTAPISGYLTNVNGWAIWWDGFVWDTLNVAGSGGSGGVTVHAALTGLGSDDHPHYYNLARLNSWFVTKSHMNLLDIGSNTHTQIDVHITSTSNPHAVDEIDILPSQTGNNGKALITNGSIVGWQTLPSGVTDHGLLNGLADDDHSLYHTDSRANIWFTTKNLSNLGTKSHTSLTDAGANLHSVLDAGLSASTSHIANTANPHSVIHDQLTGLADDDHTQYHNVSRANTWFTTKSVLGLTDTPVSFSGETGKVLLVNAGETALEFSDYIADHGDLTGLADDDHTQYHNNTRAVAWLASQSILDVSDTPSSYSGQSGKILAVNGGETALEFVTQSGGSAPSTLITSLICLYDNTTYFTIGDTTDLGFSFRYDAKRNMTTEFSEAGHITLVYDSIAKTVSYTSNFIGTDLGLDIQADINGADVRLKLIVDNVNANNLTFNLYTTQYSDIDTIIVNNPSKLISYTNCPDNATTNISIGTLSDVAYRISYIAERNIVPARKVAGMIDILYDDVAGVVSYYSDQIPAKTTNDLGFDIEADLSGASIRLNLIVDNSTTNNLFFDYKIISKFHE